MASRFRRELSVADVVTLGTAVCGFAAIAIAPADAGLAARLVLLAAVADGLDGVLARRYGGSPIGPHLDSLADVAAFGVAPGVIVYGIAQAGTIPEVPPVLEQALILAIPAVFAALAILRLGVYSAYDVSANETVGVPSTLAATILGAGVLGLQPGPVLGLAGTAILAGSMVAPIRYPDLLARDALLMGVVHVLAVLLPTAFGRVFPFALLTLAMAYLVLGPGLYWGESERRLRDATGQQG